MFCPRLSEFSPFIETQKMISFQQEKVKFLHKYCPAATGTAFSPKFILDATVQKQCFYKKNHLEVFFATELP